MNFNGYPEESILIIILYLHLSLHPKFGKITPDRELEDTQTPSKEKLKVWEI